MEPNTEFKVELNGDQRSNIADLIFDMRITLSKSGLIQKLFSDEDLLRMAIFAWTEKETKKQRSAVRSLLPKE